MTVTNRVNQTIEQHQLLNSGDSVLVALSGGPDSVALSHLLDRLKKRLKLTLRAVYINHNIRKQAAKKEEKFCRSLCSKMGIELDIVSKDIPALAKSSRKSVEQAARDFRYETFEHLAETHKIDKIALGHHLDDRVETVLFRVIRGTGKTGLAGIPAKRGRVIRPLSDLTKDDIYSYLKKHRLKYCLDQSNLGVDYDRNYIRNKLLPEIRNNLNPAVDRALLNLSETASQDEAFLADFVLRRFKRIASNSPGGKIQLDLNKFNRYDKWLRRRLLRHCLAEISVDDQAPDKAVVDRLDDFCRRGGKSLSVPGKIQAVSTGDKLVVFCRKPMGFSLSLVENRVCRLTTLRLNFRISVYDRRRAGIDRARQASAVLLDYDSIEPPLVVRNIGPGDRFRPLGLRGTKKVGDYLTDRKVHPVYRDEIPVVCDRKGILWLVGHEIDDRAKIDGSTRKVLRIEFGRRQRL